MTPFVSVDPAPLSDRLAYWLRRRGELAGKLPDSPVGLRAPHYPADTYRAYLAVCGLAGELQRQSDQLAGA